MHFFDFSLWAPYWLTNDINGRLDGDNDVDIDDLVIFCDDWLWIAPWSELYGLFFDELGNSVMRNNNMDTAVEGSSESFVFEEMPADTFAQEPIESIDEPFSDEQIQAMIDWTEQLWESNEDLRTMVNPENYERVLESLKGELEQ